MNLSKISQIAQIASLIIGLAAIVIMIKHTSKVRVVRFANENELKKGKKKDIKVI